MIPLASVEVLAAQRGATRQAEMLAGLFTRGDGATRELWLLENGWVRVHPADGTFPILFPPHRVIVARHITSASGELLIAEDFD